MWLWILSDADLSVAGNFHHFWNRLAALIFLILGETSVSTLKEMMRL